MATWNQVVCVHLGGAVGPRKEWRHNVPSAARLQPIGQQWELSHTTVAGKNRLTQVDLEIDNGSMIPYYENMEYDGIGNITSYTTRKNGSARNYQISYGDARFPILPTDIEVTGSQPVRETFTYDHSGSRIQRELDADNNPATANEISYFIPFGTENLAELDGRGRVRRAYTFAGSERTGYKAAGRTVLYLKDHLGSSKMTLDLYASTLQEGLQQRAGDADPYGVTWRESYAATAESEPHQYTGQEREAALDLYTYGARFYDPELGRFLAVDPAREFANPYSYVGNNPVVFFDSSGEYSVNAGNLNDEERRLVLVALAGMTGLSSDYTCDQAGNMVYEGLYFDEFGDLQIGGNAIIHDGSQTALSSLSDFMNSPIKSTLDSPFSQYLKDKTAFAAASTADELRPLMKTTTIDFDDFNAQSALLFSKNIPKESFGLGTVLFHEFHHNFFDSKDPNVDGPMGAAVEYVNKIRDELGFPMRKQYKAQIIKNRPGWYRIDFFVIAKGKHRLVGSVQMNYKLVAPKKNFQISNAN
jgi:RHS repeat-associated protein